MKVAGKIRFSTSKQDGESQRHELEEWAKANGHIITFFEENAISGRKGLKERDSMEDMLKRCEAGEFEAVAVVELSRFGRTMKIISDVMERLTTKGVKVIISKTNKTIDYKTLEGRAFVGAMALGADIEWCLIQERNARGREKIKREKIKVGRKPSEEKGINLEAVIALRGQGKGIRETARLLNTSAPTILRMLKRYEDAQLRNVTQSIQNGTQTPEKTVSVTLDYERRQT